MEEITVMVSGPFEATYNQANGALSLTCVETAPPRRVTICFDQVATQILAEGLQLVAAAMAGTLWQSDTPPVKKQ